MLLELTFVACFVVGLSAIGYVGYRVLGDYLKSSRSKTMATPLFTGNGKPIPGMNFVHSGIVFAPTLTCFDVSRWESADRVEFDTTFEKLFEISVPIKVYGFVAELPIAWIPSDVKHHQICHSDSVIAISSDLRTLLVYERSWKAWYSLHSVRCMPGDSLLEAYTLLAGQLAQKHLQKDLRSLS